MKMVWLNLQAFAATQSDDRSPNSPFASDSLQQLTPSSIFLKWIPGLVSSDDKRAYVLVAHGTGSSLFHYVDKRTTTLRLSLLQAGNKVDGLPCVR